MLAGMLPQTTSRAALPGCLCHRSVSARPTPRPRIHLQPARAASGKDVVDGWLDIAKFVSSSGNQQKTAFDDLASSIGRDVYLDVGGWHLYLRDLTATGSLKMSQVLAQKFGPQVGRSGINRDELTSFLKSVPVKLGAGKLKVSLHDVIPSACVGDLEDILEAYGRNK